MTSFQRQASRPKFRPLHGILLLDKHAGVSSNRALQQVRRLFRADKAGHTGSLDPLATGLLPICFGEATKIAGVLLGESKSYAALARLGTTTDTDDADGAVLRTRDVPDFDGAALEAVLAPLRGRIRQRPPIYAALKQGGEPLYAKARRGEIVEVAEREVDVARLECVARGEDWLRLEIDCGSGTYVRSLVRDLGETLGCGAHVAELRRLWVEPFRTPRMYPLSELEAISTSGENALDACLLPIEAGMSHLSQVTLDAEQARRLGHGQPVALGLAAASCIAVLDASGRALGLGRVDADGALHAQRLFAWAVALNDAM